MRRSLPVYGYHLEVLTVEDALAPVREHGGRVTSSRRLPLEARFDGAGYHTAQKLAEPVQSHAPDVALSTVNSNLEKREKPGVVVHSQLGHGPASYDRAEDAYSHLVCQNCTTAMEAPDELFRSLAKVAPDRFGFEFDTRHLAIPGRCAASHNEEDA